MSNTHHVLSLVHANHDTSIPLRLSLGSIPTNGNSHSQMSSKLDVLIRGNAVVQVNGFLNLIVDRPIITKVIDAITE